MKPNIVMIMADQLRKDCLGAYGNEFINTPNIDRLINGGMCFRKGYVANPICMPNRNSILSGRIPSNHKVWTNGIIVHDCKKSFTHEIKSNDYQTANIGKMHLNTCGPQSAGLSFESNGSWTEVPTEDAYTGGYFDYDHVELTIGHTAPKAHYYKWFKDNGGTDDMFDIVQSKYDIFSGDKATGVRKMPSALSSTTFIGERSVNYIKNVADKNRPFFLTVSFPDPHQPFTSCYDDYEKIKGRSIKAPIGSPDDLKTRPCHYMQHFRGEWSRKGINPAASPNGVPKKLAEERILHTYAMVERIDINVGKILDALENEGIMDNSIIIFTSDHGELLGDHGLWTKGPFFYEGLVNVPVVFYGKNIKNITTDDLFSSIDFAPTICELAGCKVPEYMDGVSHAEYLYDAHEEKRSQCLIEYRNGYGASDKNSNVLITKNYKIAVYENGTIELTDLLNDPQEKKNVADEIEYQQIKNDLIEKMLIEKLKDKSKGDIQYGLS